MKVVRAQLVQHLSRIFCNKLCSEVVFRDAFGATLLTPDQQLLIVAPSLESVEPLADEIGVQDLSLLTKALRLFGAEGNYGRDVTIYVEENRLVIEEERGTQRLVLSAPKTIATRIEQATVDKILGAISDEAPAVQLTSDTLSAVRGAFGLYGAEEIELRASKGQLRIIVGTDKTHRAEFTIEAEEMVDEFSVILGRQAIEVFASASDLNLTVTLTAPDKPVLVTDGEYSYILSPKARSADERAVKSTAKAEKGKKGKGGKKKDVDDPAGA
jgi:hypothetical protein